MNDPTRDRLDDAIDRTASRLVGVSWPPDLLDRIVARLPDRPAGHAWGIDLLPHAGVVSLVALLAMFWMSGGREDDEVRELLAATPVAVREMPVLEVAPERPSIADAPSVRAAAVMPSIVLLDEVDHERSLPPVTLGALDLAALDPPLWLEQAPLEIAPIVLDDLPLSTESRAPGK